jgi:phosphoglycolate phosphatase
VRASATGQLKGGANACYRPEADIRRGRRYVALMPIRARPILLLDLDGTLVDPAPGILGCYRHALAAFGVFPPEGEDLRWVIGPPIRQAFGQLLDGRGDTEEAVRLYRQRYSDWGLYQAAVYPGVLEALTRHVTRGTRLILCTAKSRGFARRVVDHFGLAPLLSGLYGSELDGRFEDKGELIAHILQVEGLQPHEVCMVGDRKHDVIAAARHGIPAVGVLWGFGGRDELQAAGAEMLIDAAAQLLPDLTV